MANSLLRQSLRFARPSAAGFVFPGQREWFVNANCFRRQTFATSEKTITIDTTDEASELPSTVSGSSPWLMLSSNAAGKNNSNKFYSLAENKVIRIKKKSLGPDPDAYCVGSAYGWVGLINRRPDFDFFISNPVTGRNIKLPSIQTLHRFGENDLLWKDYQSFWCISRAIISSPNPDAEDCRVLVHYHPAKLSATTRLAFCSPGCGDGDNNASSWTLLDCPLARSHFVEYEHITYSPRDGRFFAMNSDFEMESWDLSDVSNPTRHPVVSIDEENLRAHVDHMDDYSVTLGSVLKNKKHRERCLKFDCKTYLIADQCLSGQLFFIQRYIAEDMMYGRAAAAPSYYKKKLDVYPYKTVSFEVYRFDTNADSDRTLKYMDSLGDSAFFIGLNGGSVLSAKDHPGIIPNSIYFTDDLNYGPCYGSGTSGAYIWMQDYEHIDYGGHDIGIYSYSEGSIKKCYYPITVQKCKKIQPSPVWFSPYYI